MKCSKYFLLTTILGLFSSIADEHGGASLRLENMTKIPGSDVSFPSDRLLVFHHNLRLEHAGRVTATRCHDRNILRVHSTGTIPLVIQGVDLDSTVVDSAWHETVRFSLASINGHPVSEETFPLTVPPGAYADMEIVFSDDFPDHVRIHTGSLRLRTNAPGAIAKVELHGGHMARVEGGNELNAQQIINIFGFRTSMAGISPSADIPKEREIRRGDHGDVIFSKLYEQADPAQPVRAIVLASFKSPGSFPVKLIPPDSDIALPGAESAIALEWHQTILPRDIKNPAAVAGFSVPQVSGSFRISIGGYTTGTGNSKKQHIDEISGIRVYRAIGPDGLAIPFSYIVIQDYVGDGCGVGSANCDWQDGMAYFSNIKPIAAAKIGSSIPDLVVKGGRAFAVSVADAFDPGYPGNRLSFQANLADGRAIPAWVTFDTEFGTLRGTPPAGTHESLRMRVSAKDSNGIPLSAARGDEFEVHVE